jgi:hypothetical protein
MCTLTAVVLKHYDPKAFDFGKKKAFPMRPQHFYASCAKAMKDLDWSPQFSSEVGLKDSYENDFVHKKVRVVYSSTIPVHFVLVYCTIMGCYSTCSASTVVRCRTDSQCASSLCVYACVHYHRLLEASRTTLSAMTW